MREQRAGAELEFAGLLVVKVDPGEVRRQKVRGKLQPAEFTAKRDGKRFRKQRFSGPRHVFQQHMPVAEKTGEQQLDHLFLPYHDLADILPQPVSRVHRILHIHG
ncbi:hypothetical protein D1872_295040 [compost metagenome]